MKIFSFFFATLLTMSIANISPAQAATADDAVGVWKTKTGRYVQLYKCGANLCGKITKAKAGEKDVKNPNPKLRSRSLKGVRILSGASKSSAKAWKGTLYNTRDGNNYTGYITVRSLKRVDLSGCTLGGLICQTEPWDRIQ